MLHKACNSISLHRFFINICIILKSKNLQEDLFASLATYNYHGGFKNEPPLVTIAFRYLIIVRPILFSPGDQVSGYLQAYLLGYLDLAQIGFI